MGWGTGNIGGGSDGLNFKVVAYATETALMAAIPKENTIGIITTTPITSWFFDAVEPETVADGMVWFPTGTSGAVEFNALKKNGIQVYPLDAKQYVSGAWVDKTAKSYQNGKWVDFWNGNLYDSGNEFDSVTGGWGDTNFGYLWGSSTSPVLPVTKNTNNMVISHVSGSKVGIVGTKNRISVTGYSELKMLYSATGSGKNDAIALLTGKNCAISVSEDVAAYALIQQGNNREISVPLSGLSGNTYYVAVTSDASTTTINKIWLE